MLAVWKAKRQVAQSDQSSRYRAPGPELTGSVSSLHTTETRMGGLICLHGNNPLVHPLDVFLPSGHLGAWWAAFYGITQSRTRLKRLSSSSGHI